MILAGRAHPRSRGENTRRPPATPISLGSSPLTRGKLPGGGPGSRGRRLIPAHAGKTSPCLRWRNRAWAHPRSRGENAWKLKGKAIVSGSSPLTRGKRASHPHCTRRPGLIPAHAGKTLDSANPHFRTRAHPRSRGENAVMNHPAAAALGSSPLTRGKHLVVNQAVPRRGLIPAHAGKTQIASTSGRSPGAHPRSRGENLGVARVGRGGLGSSPLTRGKHADDGAPVDSHGLIPAHAGKTPTSSASSTWTRAHPRSRGENSARTRTQENLLGSSPLTRGKRMARRSSSRPDRLIPAHAGKTR